MDFGVPVERHRTEHRVGLTPRGVRALVDLGHRVFVETGAGDASRFPDSTYREAGAEIVFRREEVFGRAAVLLCVTAPTMDEVALADGEQTLAAFWHLAVAPKTLVAEMARRRLTAIGYEMIADADGRRPVLEAMSELAGQMAIHNAAHLLQRESGGRGILLGASPGQPPATVLIFGAGTAGRAAAETAVGIGAHVIVLDKNLDKLRHLRTEIGGRVVTSTPDRETIAQFLKIADVAIGAILVVGEPTPYLVSKDMVQTMRPGSVILDLSIDQGGCFETSRPTTIDDPTYVHAGVVHYCVPNMTADIPRTASKALTLAHMPYLELIAGSGLEPAIRLDQSLARGTAMYRGTITNDDVATVFSLEYRPIESLVGGEVRS
jgi:alanine dehydrogenase